MTLEKIKEEILRLTREYSREVHKANRPGDDAHRIASEGAGEPSVVPYAGRVFTEDEVEAAVSSTLDFWLTLGTEGAAFEKELATFLGVKHSLLVNSGSSANLIAITCLTTHKLPDHKRLRPGDEVITCAAGFPTTVAPILQNSCVPVFLDNDPVTGNARVEDLEKAYTPGKTKAVMMAHTLGNPFDLAAILAFCKKYDLWLVEDNCDALGSTYSLPVETAQELGLDHLIKLAGERQEGLPRIQDGILTAYTGSFGDISTQSFYPPHHLTMGEGGAVNIIRRAPLKTYAESFRDWGRDCWCPSGKDNTCAKRFGWQLGELPAGYDHKYIYSHLGYNLKPLDPQAAIGRVQLRRLDGFIAARKRNWETLRRGLADLETVFGFSLPTHARAWTRPGAEASDSSSRFEWEGADQAIVGPGCDPSWFGFMLRVKPDAPFTVRELAAHLDEKRIGNRMLFGGNLLRQPAFVQLRKDNPAAFRTVAETMEGADDIMHTAIFLGTYPGLSDAQLAYEIQTIRSFVESRCGATAA